MDTQLGRRIRGYSRTYLIRVESPSGIDLHLGSLFGLHVTQVVPVLTVQGYTHVTQVHRTMPDTQVLLKKAKARI